MIMIGRFELIGKGDHIFVAYFIMIPTKSDSSAIDASENLT